MQRWPSWVIPTFPSFRMASEARLHSPKGCSAEPPWEVTERGGSVPLLCPETGGQPVQNHTVLLEGVVKVKIPTTLPLCNSISQARNWLGLLYTFLPFQRKPRHKLKNLEIPEQALRRRPRPFLSGGVLCPCTSHMISNSPVRHGPLPSSLTVALGSSVPNSEVTTYLCPPALSHEVMTF